MAARGLNILGHGASRKVLKALGVFGSVQAIGIACSLVRAKLIAIWIGPMGVGLFAIFNSVLDMLSSTTQLNMRQSAVREVSDASASQLPRLAAAVRWWARSLGIFGAAVMLIGSPLLSLISFGHTDHWLGFAILSVPMYLLSVTAGEQTLLQGNGQLKRLAKCTMWGAVGGTAVSIPLYYWLGQNSILPSIVIFTVATLVATLAMPNVASGSIPRRESIEIGRSFMSLGLYLTISTLAATGASYAFLSYLNQVASTSEVGIYQAGYTLIIRYVGVIFTAISMEFYPRLSRVASRPGIASRVVSHEIAVLVCVLMPVVISFVCADELLLKLLYTSEFLDALPLIWIGIGGAIFRAISYCLAFVIISRGDGKMFIITDVSSAIIGVGLNIAFYHFWGLAGLGASYVLWYAIYTVIVWAVYRGRYHMCLSRKTLILCAWAILIVGAAMWLRTLGWWQPLLTLAPAAFAMLQARK